MSTPDQAPSTQDTPEINLPVRYHVPGVISHAQRAVLHFQPLLGTPGGPQAVLRILKQQAAVYGVGLMAVVVRADRYDMLLSHRSAVSTGDFLCVANRSISGALRPKTWSSTFWNGDRPGIDLVTEEPGACAGKLLELLSVADAALLRQLEKGLAAEQDEIEVHSTTGPVLLAYVQGPTPRRRKQRKEFVRQVREGLARQFVAQKGSESPEASRLPGSSGATPLHRRRPRFFGLVEALRDALTTSWLDFQLAYRTAAKRLKNHKPRLTFLGFPSHCFGPPVPTPP